MGCTSSKQARFDLHEGRKPVSRTFSLSFRRPNDVAGGGRQHVVSLMSSTLGSLRLDRPDEGEGLEAGPEEEDGDEAMKKNRSDDRHRWSETRTTPTEPETINTWELMAGLDDISPTRAAVVERSYSLPAASPPPEADETRRETAERVKGVQELNNPLDEKNGLVGKAGLVKARIHAFQEKINARRAMSNAAKVTALSTQVHTYPPLRGEGKVVIYFTSLRSVRKTYEDCCEVLIILRGCRVRIDERDVSMHNGFKEELYGALGVVSGSLRLPRIFADGRYLGGAEEIRQMHEMGVLLEAVQSCTSPLSMKDSVAACPACGDVRFVPCKVCSGSCKVFIEEDAEVAKEGQVSSTVGFRRCSECNENGLVRCPLCCVS